MRTLRPDRQSRIYLAEANALVGINPAREGKSSAYRTEPAQAGVGSMAARKRYRKALVEKHS